MERKLARFTAGVLVAGICVLGNWLAHAQDKKVPEPEAAPSLPKTYSKEAPKTGLAAKGASVVLITPRGGFSLSFSTSDKTGTVFEYVGKGFDSKLTYQGSQDDFLYFSVEGWQIIAAIRNHANSSGTHDVWFFINGGSTPVKYSDGLPYPPA